MAEVSITTSKNRDQQFVHDMEQSEKRMLQSAIDLAKPEAIDAIEVQKIQDIAGLKEEIAYLFKETQLTEAQREEVYEALMKVASLIDSVQDRIERNKHRTQLTRSGIARYSMMMRHLNPTPNVERNLWKTLKNVVTFLFADEPIIPPKKESSPTPYIDQELQEIIGGMQTGQMLRLTQNDGTTLFLLKDTQRTVRLIKFSAEQLEEMRKKAYVRDSSQLSWITIREHADQAEQDIVFEFQKASPSRVVTPFESVKPKRFNNKNIINLEEAKPSDQTPALQEAV